MKKITTRWIVLFLLFSFPIFANAQYYHRLAATDFEGSPPRGTNFLAYTHCSVTYNYQVTQYNNRYDVDFDVQIDLNKDKSYIRLNEVKDLDMLHHVLMHEQGHYNIAYLLKCELAKVFKSHRYTANYQNEITTLFTQVNDKYQHLNDEYERQTEHMQNDANQEKWNAWFSRAIDNTPVRAYAER